MKTPTAWIAHRLGQIPTAKVQLTTSVGNDISLQFGDGPVLRVRVISLTKVGTLTVSRLVKAGLPRVSDGQACIYATPTLRAALRDQMAAKRLSWVESGGDAVHLDLAPYYIHEVTADHGAAVARAEPEAERSLRWGTARPTRLVGRSGVCAEAIILWWLVERRRPDLLPPLTQTTLAQASGVTGPMAGHVLHRLEATGSLIPERVGKRTKSWRIDDIEKVLLTWADEDHEPTRATRAYVYARHTKELLLKLRNLDETQTHWALGGVAAANRYAPTLTADPTPTVCIPDHGNPADAAKAIGGEIVTEGANLVFWQSPRDSWRTFSTDRYDSFSHGHDAHNTNVSLGSDVTRHTEQPARWLRDLIHEVLPDLVDTRDMIPLSMTSPARALQQALQDGSGRSAEVALALSERLGITHG